MGYLKDMSDRVIELLAANVAVLIYSGDDDFMVDWLGSKDWMYQLDWPYRREWARAVNEEFYVDGRPSGKVQTSHGLTFVQVYNAGHLVPMDEPLTSVAMVQEFLSADSAWRRQVDWANFITNMPGTSLDPQDSAIAIAFLFATLVCMAVVSVFAIQWWRSAPNDFPPAYHLMA